MTGSMLTQLNLIRMSTESDYSGSGVVLLLGCGDKT